MKKFGLEELHLDNKAFDAMDNAHFSRVRETVSACCSCFDPFAQSQQPFPNSILT
jgi:hypothetical protein